MNNEIDVEQQIRNANTQIDESSILLFRKSLFYVMSWFTQDNLQSEPMWKIPFKYYERFTGAESKIESTLKLSEESRFSSFSKFDYFLLKYLIWKYSTSRHEQNGDIKVYIDLRTLQNEIEPHLIATSTLKSHLKTGLEKFLYSAFQLGGSNHRFPFINSYTKWEASSNSMVYTGFEVELNGQAFVGMLPLPSIEEPSIRRIQYPLKKMFGLYRISKTVNFFLTLDRILTLPAKFDRKANAYRTRPASEFFLTHGYGRSDILPNVIQTGVSKNVFNEPVISGRDDDRQYSFLIHP
jgi:hypothetical protein